jgi:hypothetical protein
MSYCPHCGASRNLSRDARIAGVAFLLNEMDAHPMTDVLTAQQRARLETHYEDELSGISPRRAPAPQSAMAPISRGEPAARRAPALAAPPPPRAPRDWSWLTEQQANLFLFAGAFLTVVAALIYVGYSGQAVGGALKMTLLVAYTLAFIAGGVVCLRIPRVAIAGQVFFAVGAILVPMNFVAARGILSDEDLSTESMWLAGSIVTAAFYTCVACLGLGRLYAFGAGVALTSATLAAVVIAGLPVEWAPACFIALAIAMALPAIAGPATLRSRIGPVWSLQAHAVAGAAILFAIAIAPFAGTNDEISFDATTRWFLPVNFAAFSLCGATLALNRSHAAPLMAIAGFSGAFASTTYALDLPAEYYVVNFAALALILGVSMPAVDAAAARLPEGFASTLRYAAIAATMLSAFAMLLVLNANAGEDRVYDLTTRWYLAPAFALILAFYLLDAFARRSRAGVAGALLALAGLCASVVYGLDASPEYYAFALVAPAIVLAAAARWAAHPWLDRLPAEWRDDACIFTRGVTAAALAVAVGAARAGEVSLSYDPQYRAFLPIAFVAATTGLVIDASRRRRADLSAAVLVSVAGAIVGTAYAVDAGPAWYGVAFAAAAIVFAGAGRAWTPSWIDAGVRDVLAAIAITVAWLPFAPAYGDDQPRIGAAVNFAAAFFYAAAAVVDRGTLTFRQFVDIPGAQRVRVSTAWLYPAGLTATLGYVFVLRSLPGAESAEAGSLTMPLVAASAAFALAGAVLRRLRPEFRLHLYAISLLGALASLTMTPDARSLAIALTVFVAVSIAVAAWEDEPMLAAPAAIFGFAAIAAWRQHADAAFSVIPISYALVAVVAYAAGTAFRARRQWSGALRAAAALYAPVAPIAGFGILRSQAGIGGLVDGTPFQETALYEWSTLALALAGVLALVEWALSGRRWVVVPATAIITVALLLQIGRFNPENPQAYTAVIGTYLLLLGVLGLWKYRAIPELDEAAPIIEALGAAIIMFPSFVQSIEAGWRYQWIMLAEAALFFTASVVLRRRGVLAASLVAMVLVAGRALFDAVNALPNWVVVMIAGVALLAIGMSILLGRERWSRWQQSLLGWWEEAGGHPAH